MGHPTYAELPPNCPINTPYPSPLPAPPPGMDKPYARAIPQELNERLAAGIQQLVLPLPLPLPPLPPPALPAVGPSSPKHLFPSNTIKSEPDIEKPSYDTQLCNEKGKMKACTPPLSTEVLLFPAIS